jgi:restriction system protein
MVNPRHISGSYRLINTYELLVPDNIGVYRLSERGNAFLNEDPKAVQEIDEAEGLTKLLEILAIKTRSKRADLLPEWGDYLRKFSKLGTDSTIKSTLLNRLINLAERGLVKRDGIYYSITPSGIELVNKSPIREIEPMRNVLRSISAFNNDQRSALRENLEKMHPYRFEQLIRDLLEAMGYDDVQVTRATGDKGVDVVATVQFGITTITEVVQVKRQQGNIGREILDQLRGALPYHKAIRGTIITIGDFTKKCKEAALFPGAAPIGLIDGDRLLDLLFEHEIGIKERPATLYELDLDCFSETISSEEIINGTEDADENLGN